MEWIRVQPGSGQNDRAVRADFIVEVQIKLPLAVKLIDRRGNVYGWSGTAVEWAEVAKALGLNA